MARFVVYTDYTYRRGGGEEVYADRAFALFLGQLARSTDRLVVVGKIDPAPGPLRYLLPAQIRFCETPYYPSMTRFGTALTSMSRSIAVFWRVLDDVDGAWLLGPHPLALVYAAMALVRRKSVTLGVRQDFPRYVRARHPGRRWLHRVGDLLDGIWRLLARVVPTIVVGPALAQIYRHGRSLEIAVSLVHEHDLAPPEVARDRRYEEGDLRILSVGRLEEEKNPLLLADIAAELLRHSSRWRLQICGEGPLEDQLRKRIGELGISEHVELLGYLEHDSGLADLYRSSHALLHVSWTEGLPQVLLEACAARLPIVATGVGGVPAAFAETAILIEPGAAAPAASALQRVCGDAGLRTAMIERGVEVVAQRTLEAEARRVLAFLEKDLAV